MMASIRPGVVIAMVLGLVGVIAFAELRQSSGRVVDCVVEEVLPGSKGSTAFSRCEGVLTKVPVSDIAARIHGQPAVGQRIAVKETKSGPQWDKPAARHPVSALVAPFALLLIVIVWSRRNA